MPFVDLSEMSTIARSGGDFSIAARASAADRAARNHEIFFLVDQLLQPVAYDRMVVDEQDPGLAFRLRTGTKF